MSGDCAGSLPAVSVLGIGAITPLGRDLAVIAQGLSEPAEAPGGETSPAARRVADEVLAEPSLSRRMRRADRFSRMATIAALDAWAAAQGATATAPVERVGVIVATGLGPHVRTFRFLDGILDCGDNSALPTDFSHSVHNAAAAYITEILGLPGRSCTVADFETGFEQAVLLAQCWLAEGACSQVIVGAVEELGQVLLHLVPRMVGSLPIVPGEGAVFLTLGPAQPAQAARATQPAGYALLDAMAKPACVDLLIRDEPAIAPAVLLSEASQADVTVRGRQSTSFSPFFGHTASSSAFQVLGGLLSLQQRRALGSAGGERGGAVDSAATLKRLCNGAAATLLLTNAGI